MSVSGFRGDVADCSIASTGCQPAWRRCFWPVAILMGLAFSAATGAPPVGSDAPPVVLRDLHGTEVRTASFADRPMLLLFGELNQERARQACGEAMTALADPRVAATNPVAILVVAQDAAPSVLLEEVAKGHFPPIILHDPKREAFEAYQIVTTPTAVVVDVKGKVVQAMPGFAPRFRDLLIEALLVASGQAPAIAAGEAPGVDPNAEKVSRLVHLGRELTRHGLFELAEARFAEALRIDPASEAAQVGLGELMLKQDRPADAEPLFRAVLVAHADSAPAILGMAAVQIHRATEDDLEKAEVSLRDLIKLSPKLPKAYYLLGSIYQRRAEYEEAAFSFRKAAELALDALPAGNGLPDLPKGSGG